MRIKLLFFGMVREIFGCDSLLMKMPEGARVRDVVRALFERAPGAALNEIPLVYAVNESYETEEKVLSEDDELAFMTPMSGG